MLNSLQILRGLAAWMVVFHHVIQSYYMSAGTSESKLMATLTEYGHFGVDLFFVLSGVVMALVARKYQGAGVDFAVGRVFRVVPVYWFYTLLLVISVLIFPTGTYLTWWEDFSLLKSLAFIPHANPNGYGYYPTLYVGWTLIYEMFFYFVFSMVLIFKLPKPTITCAILLLAIAFVFRNMNLLGHSSLLLVEFAIGIAIYEYFKATQSMNRFSLKVLPVAAFLVMISLAFYIGREDLANYFIAGLIVYSFILTEWLFSKDIKVFHFLKVLGDYSYSTYLSHIIVIGWFYYLFGGEQSKDYGVWPVFGIALVVLIISKYSYKYIETSPYILNWKRMTVKLLTKG
jgi:exopolysaccharide production protein ExoZ